MAESSDPVRQEDFLAFLKGYVPEHRQGDDRELLAGRYRILSNQPLPELSSAFAKAYVARDEKSPDLALYALAYTDDAPLRQKNINALKTYRHPSLVSVLADGVMDIGTAREQLYTVVLTRPAGQPLAQLLSTREPVSETVLVSQYLRPLIEILAAFQRMGISHNRINPHTVFVSGNSIMLGECIGEPSGFSQEFLFEPVERLLASPHARADYAPSADCYALAVLALHLLLGFAPFAQVTKEQLVREILAMGAYHTLVMPWDLPAGLHDFFRGLLGEGKRERWDAAMLESWVNGRRLNLVEPTPPRDTTRGFEFENRTHFNRKSLAHTMWQHWKDARTLLADSRLGRWLKMHAGKHDTADAVARVAAPGSDRNAAQEDEALSREITLLDQQGPLRFRQVSVAVEGIGAALAHALLAAKPDEARAIVQMMDADLPAFWIEQQKASPDFAALAARLQKARQHLRMKGLGFGMERCLYDLNPGLPCMSPLVKGHHVATLADALTTLDAVARDRAATLELSDAHLAAFIASRLELNREIKLHELQSLPRLMADPLLAMLKLLAQAHRKIGQPPLRGLSAWLAAGLLPLLDGMHNRARQRKLQSELRDRVAKGSPETLAELFLNPATLEADMRDFQKAVADYALRRRQIAELKGTSGVSLHAGAAGRGVAQSLAYGVCIATIYVTLKSFFNL